MNNNELPSEIQMLGHNYFTPHILVIDENVTPDAIRSSDIPPSTFSAILAAGAKANTLRELPKFLKFIYLESISDPSVVHQISSPHDRIFVLNQNTNPLAVPGIPDGSMIQIANASPEVIASLVERNYTLIIGGAISPDAMAKLPEYFTFFALGPYISREALQHTPPSIKHINVVLPSTSAELKSYIESIDAITKLDINLSIHGATTEMMQAITPGSKIILHGCCNNIQEPQILAIPARCEVTVDSNLPASLVSLIPKHVSVVIFGNRASASSVAALPLDINPHLLPGGSFELIATFFELRVLPDKNLDHIKLFINMYLKDRDPEFMTQFMQQFMERINEISGVAYTATSGGKLSSAPKPRPSS